ncbi:hypothetical protein FP744_10002042 [Trichoderma asperellum]
MASCELSGTPDAPSYLVTRVSPKIMSTKRVSFVLPVKPREELEPECWPFGRKSREIKDRLTTEELRHLLPASFRNGIAWIGIPEHHVEQFLTSDLSVDRLMKAFDCFFVLGKEYIPPRALSYQQALGLEITVIEKMDMHLLYSKDKIFIKPFPRYLLELKFWHEFLECPEECPYHSIFAALRREGRLDSGFNLMKLKPCNHSIIWMRAMGFAFSYVALVRNKSDFEIAKAKNLIPGDLDFEDWKYFVSRVLSDNAGGKILRQIDKRFTFGELNLERLNQILMIRSPLMWLFQGNEYRGFVQGHFFLPHLSIYVAVVLGYMLAGTVYTKFKKNKVFVFATMVLVGCLWSVIRSLSFVKGESPVACA